MSGDFESVNDWPASAAFPLPSTSPVTVVPRDTVSTSSSSSSGAISGAVAGIADGGVPAPARVTWIVDGAVAAPAEVAWPDAAGLTVTRTPVPLASWSRAVATSAVAATTG